MTRNLKALGLALMAIFALGAVAASAASAQGKLTSTGGVGVTLTAEETGVEKNSLTAFGGKVECPGSTYTGHLVTTQAQTGGVEHKNAGTGSNLIASGSSTATLTPHYKEVSAGTANCNGTAGTSVTVDMNGCDYVIHLGATTASPPADEYGVTFDIVCPTGNQIAITFWGGHNHAGGPICVVHIPPQTGLTGADAIDTNTADGHVELTGTVVGIETTKTLTGGGILCPHDTDENAEFHIDATVKAHNEAGNPVGISLSD